MAAGPQERGQDTRIAIIESLLKRHNQTEDELVASVGVSKSTIRNAITLLQQHGLLAKARRKKDDGTRGPGSYEYWLTTQIKSAEYIEKQLRELATGKPRQKPGKSVQAHETPAAPVPKARLFVIVKAGTNDAVLTKDGRMLRVEDRVLERVMSEYERVLKTKLESLTIDSYYERYYPEFSKGTRERPTW